MKPSGAPEEEDEAMTSASEDHPAGAGSTGSESGSPSEPEPGSGSRAEPGAWGRALWLLIAILPRNAISRCAGRLASLRLPAALQRAEILLFARLAGVDLALVEVELGAEALAARLAPLAPPGLALERIANRGAVVWCRETGVPTTSLLADQWTCRFTAEGAVAPSAVADLMRRTMEAGLEVVRSENLYVFGDVPGWRPFEAARG